jgi:DNA-binding CsgD family transcriptional regulator
LKSDHDLSGLFQYAAKDEWSGCFEEALGDHLGAAMLEFGLEHEEIVDLLGEHWAMTLWGCAFEDLLTREFEPHGANIADDYLKRRGWKETPGARAYIRALRPAVMSLYEVSEVKPGRSFLARDLIRGGEPVLVSEKSATQTLNAWDRIAARIVPIGEKRILAGGLLPFTMEAADDLINGLRKAEGKRSRRAKLAIDDDMLRSLAHLFTTAWLFDVLPKAMGRDAPRLHNSDGDEVVFHKVRFPLVARATHKAVAAKLDAMTDLQKEKAGFWNWLGGRSTGRPRGDGQPSTLNWNVTMADGTVVLGNIELKDRAVLLSVNSAARAAQGAERLQGVLADLVRSALTEIQTMDQVRESAADAPPIEEIPLEVATGLVHAMLDKQYRACLEWSRRGKSSADIGKILGLSPRTVDEHFAIACKALGVRTRVQAVAMALSLGLLPYRAADVSRPQRNP